MFDYDSTKALAEWVERMGNAYQPNGIPCGANELTYRALAIKLRRLAEYEAREPTLTITGNGDTTTWMSAPEFVAEFITARQ